MARFSDPDEARAYLASLSDHPDRPGDTSRLNPRFAVAMANSISDARAAGMPVRLLSGQREGSVTGSKYDMAGYSSHIYGLASDVEGIGPAGSDTAAQWRQIAQANGLSSPYNPSGSEWNHWQFGPKLETDPRLLARLKAAHASGDDVAMWNAFTPTGSPVRVASADGSVPASAAGAPSVSLGGSGATLSHEQFIRDYARKIGVNPDQAVAIARAEGLNAWSASNPNAGSYVDRSGGQPFSFGDFQLNTKAGLGVDALKAGVDPRDPNQWQAADKFALDRMKAGGLGPWMTDPAAKAIAARGGLTLTSAPAGIVDPSIVARGGTSPPIPDANGGAAVAAAPAASTAAAPPQNVGDWLRKLGTKPPPTKDDKGNVVQGKSPLEAIAGSFANDKPQAAPEIPAMPQPAPAQDPMMGMAPAAQQLFQSVSEQAAKPLTWSSRPYGSNAGFQGTTLNATGYGDGYG